MLMRTDPFRELDRHIEASPQIDHGDHLPAMFEYAEHSARQVR